MTSVLIPTYNRAAFLKEAILSIKNQTVPVKIIVWDDGSEDETEKICRMLEVEYHKGEHRGVAYARNRLLELIDTPYAAWQDSDDVSEPSRIEKQLNAIQDFDLIQSNLRACFRGINNLKRCKTRQIDIRNYYTGRVEDMYGNMAFATSLFRQELAQVKFNERKTTGGEDVRWFLDLMAKGYRFGHIDETLYRVREHVGRMTYQRKISRQENVKKFVQLVS